jgi:hypothetical protein
MTTTTTLGLTKPPLSTGDVWGDLVNDNFDAIDAFATDTIADLADKAAASHTHVAASVTDFSEAVDDRVSALLTAGSNITLDYNDSVNTLTINASGGGGGGATEYDTLSDVGAATISSDIQAVRTNGYTTLGDGGGGTYVRLDAAPSDPTNNGYIRSVDRYTLSGSTDATHGGYWALLSDGSLRVEQFGAVGDYYIPGASSTSVWTVNPSPTDNYTAIMNAIQYGYTYINNTSGGLPNFSTGHKIVLGAGAYYCSDTITPDRTTPIVGQGGFYGLHLSQLVFAAGKSGIWVRTPSGAAVAGGQHSTFRDFRLLSLGYGGFTDKHGLKVEGICSAENISIDNFGGHGLSIQADIGATPGTNANLCFFKYMIITNNAQDGVYVTGGDSNAISFTGINAQSNARWGINDSSFLGNTWDACHVAGNLYGSYNMIGVNSRSVLTGCYSESGTDGSYFGNTCVVIGGLHAAGAHSVLGRGSGIQIADRKISGYEVAPDSTDTAGLQLDFRSGFNVLWNMSADGGSVKHAFLYDATDKFYGLQYAGLSGNFAYKITAQNSPITNGRSAAIGDNNLILTKGVWIGGGQVDLASGDPRFVGNATAAPTTGTWAVGDRVWNVAPTAGGFEGWICVTAGTPGTWKTYGAISA